jgi:hypothetical protein
VALKSGDRKLGRMVWDHDHEGLCRRLRFAERGEVDGNMQTAMPLLDDRQRDKFTNLERKKLSKKASACSKPNIVALIQLPPPV